MWALAIIQVINDVIQGITQAQRRQNPTSTPGGVWGAPAGSSLSNQVDVDDTAEAIGGMGRGVGGMLKTLAGPGSDPDKSPSWEELSPGALDYQNMETKSMLERQYPELRKGRYGIYDYEQMPMWA